MIKTPFVSAYTNWCARSTACQQSLVRCARGSSLDLDSAGSDVASGKTQRWLCYLQQMAKTS